MNFWWEITGRCLMQKSKSGNKAVDVCQQGTSNQLKGCTSLSQKSRWNGAFSASNPRFRSAFSGGRKYTCHRVRQLRKRLKIAQIRRTFGFCISRPLILHRRKTRCKLKCCFRLHFVTFYGLENSLIRMLQIQKVVVPLQPENIGVWNTRQLYSTWMVQWLIRSKICI